MKRISVILALVGAVLVPCFVAMPVAAATGDCKVELVAGAECPEEFKKKKDGEQALLDIIKNVTSFLSVAIGIICAVVIVAAGIMYILALGDTGKIATAKKTIIYALAGLLLSISAYGISKLILGALE